MMEIAEKDKTLEEQLSEAIEKTNHFKLQGGKIREYTEWNNRCFEIRDQIKQRDLQIERQKKREIDRLEVEAAEAERKKNPPVQTAEGKLIPICDGGNKFFLAVINEKTGKAIGYRVRNHFLGKINDQYFPVDYRTPVESFQIAMQAFFRIT